MTRRDEETTLKIVFTPTGARDRIGHIYEKCRQLKKVDESRKAMNDALSELGLTVSENASLKEKVATLISSTEQMRTEIADGKQEVEKLLTELNVERSASQSLADSVRAAGGKVLHVPITFAEDASDNPNKGNGILAGARGRCVGTPGCRADDC